MLVKQTQKVVTNVVTVANGAAATVRELELELDNTNYPQTHKIAISVRDNGGDADFSIGLKQGHTTLVDPYHNSLWQAGSAAKPEDKWMPLKLEIKGSKTYLLVENHKALTAEMQIEVALLVDSEVQNCE